MNLTWQKISTILGVLVSLVVLIGGFSTYISRFAEAEEMEEIRQFVVMNQQSIRLNQIRIEQKIVQDRIQSLEERRDRIEVINPKTPTQMERIKEYDRDIRELEMQLQQIAAKVSI